MQLRLSTVFLLVVLCFWMGSPGADEQLEQDSIVIKGDQELPRTLYIAPWKRVGTRLESGTLEGEIGEEKQPLERDLFQRELELQREGGSLESPSPAPAPPGSAATAETAR
ncbi:MAG: hypothetical protein V7700_11840 [Halioglobus sp.]